MPLETAKNNSGIETTRTDCGIDDHLLFRYSIKDVTAAESASVEHHLVACKTCREVLAALEMNARMPISAAEKEEIAQALTLTPQEQVSKILAYVEAERRVSNTTEAGFGAFIRENFAKLIDKIVPPPQIWKPAVVLASIIVVILVGRSTFNSMQSRALTNNGLSYLVADTYITQDAPRPNGGFKYEAVEFSALRGEDSSRAEDLSRYERAKVDLQKALRFDKQNSAAQQYLGTYYLLVEKDFDKAREQYQLVFAQDSTNIKALNDLGVLAWHENHYDEAANKFSLALKYEPRFFEAQYNLALVYQKQGKAEKAREEWKKYLALDQASDWANVARSYLNQ
jgi:tetratricopeptide (TPR) repeat protein